MLAETLVSPNRAYGRTLSGNVYTHEDEDNNTPAYLEVDKWSISSPVQETRTLSKAERELFVIFSKLTTEISKYNLEFKENSLDHNTIANKFFKVYAYIRAFKGQNFSFYFTDEMSFRCSFNLNKNSILLEYFFIFDHDDLDDDELLLTLDDNSQDIKCFGGRLENAFYAMHEELTKTE